MFFVTVNESRGCISVRSNGKGDYHEAIVFIPILMRIIAAVRMLHAGDPSGSDDLPRRHGRRDGLRDA